MRLDLQMIERINAWRRQQNDLPPRAEAIRRLIELALVGAVATHSRKHKAAELAAREMDRLSDRGLTGEEKATRKRRLIKGPKEFRDVPGDQPKTKS